jgi:hypothetical protein
VQRAVEGVDAGGDRRELVRAGRSERTVEVDAFCSWSSCRISRRSSARGDRVHLVHLGEVAEVQLQEVVDEAQRVVRIEERLTDRLLVRVGRDDQLRQQADRVELDVLGVVRVGLTS